MRRAAEQELFDLAQRARTAEEGANDGLAFVGWSVGGIELRFLEKKSRTNMSFDDGFN